SRNPLLRIALALLAMTIFAASARAASVGGVVTCSGASLSGAQVDALSSATQQLAGSAQTEPDGNYLITGIANGTYDLRVTTPLGSTCQTTTTYNINVTGDVTNDIILLAPLPPDANATVSGTVTGYGGLPVAGLQVSMATCSHCSGVSTV